MKIYVAAVEALRKKERQDETQFTAKIGGKTNLGPSYFISKIFIPSYTFDALLCRNWSFSPPNPETLQITLLYAVKYSRIRFSLVFKNYESQSSTSEHVVGLTVRQSN